MLESVGFALTTQLAISPTLTPWASSLTAELHFPISLMDLPHKADEVLNETVHTKCLARCLAHRETSMKMNVDDYDDGDNENDDPGIIDSLCDPHMEAATKQGKWYLIQDYCLGQHTLLVKQRMFRTQQVK